jgi:hypothetical protein
MNEQIKLNFEESEEDKKKRLEKEAAENKAFGESIMKKRKQIDEDAEERGNRRAS